MELLQLKYFMEVAHSQHVTRSAERLHIAQPSLSQAIKRLETELGVPLFAARGRNIELTEYGIFLRDRLEPVMQSLEAIPEQIKEMSEYHRTNVRLRVSAASLLVSEAIIRYRKEREKVNFRFLSGEDESLCDLSIETALEAPMETEGGDVFCCKERIYLAVPAARGQEDCPCRLEDFADEDFISLIANKKFRRICDKLCTQSGFSPRISFESDNPETVRNMIAANMGVGFWPEFTWGQLQHSNVRLVDIAEPECSRYIIIRRHKNRVDSRVVDEFYEYLKAVFTGKGQ